MERKSQQTLREDIQQRDLQITALVRENAELKAVLSEREKQWLEKQTLLDESKQALLNSFKSAAEETHTRHAMSLQKQTETTLQNFYQNSQKDMEGRQTTLLGLVTPVKETLANMQNRLQEMENHRLSEQSRAQTLLSVMAEDQKLLRQETGNLVKALRQPAARGRWGESQLLRVVEIAGMLPFVDYDTQAHVQGMDARFRPDMLVRLPADRVVVVDAKTPLEAYLEALEAPDEEAKLQMLAKHAKQLRTHIQDLAKKSYPRHVQGSADFVVMFLPEEGLLSAALTVDPSLLEFSVSQHVLLASPMTLITLLRAVAMGWKQEKLQTNTRQIAEYGQQLYQQLQKFQETFHKIGRALTTATESYGTALNTLNKRLLPIGNQMHDLHNLQSDAKEGSALLPAAVLDVTQCSDQPTNMLTEGTWTADTDLGCVHNRSDLERLDSKLDSKWESSEAA